MQSTSSHDNKTSLDSQQKSTHFYNVPNRGILRLSVISLTLNSPNEKISPCQLYLYLLFPIYSLLLSLSMWRGTTLQAQKSRIPFPTMSLLCFNLPNPFSRTVTLWLTQLLTEMSTRNFPGRSSAVDA
jgi:hypothetical protein